MGVGLQWKVLKGEPHFLCRLVKGAGVRVLLANRWLHAVKHMRAAQAAFQMSSSAVDLPGKKGTPL